jgi:hypothetical protein
MKANFNKIKQDYVNSIPLRDKTAVKQSTAKKHSAILKKKHALSRAT